MDSEQNSTLPYKRARFVTQLPTAYVYSPGHFWLSRRPDGFCRVGLTKFGSRMLGEMVDHGFEVAPRSRVIPGQSIGWVEGFKAVSELFCIATGEFAGGNRALDEKITLVNQDPYGMGWLYEVRGEPDTTCLDVYAYARLLDETIDKFLQQE